MRRRYLQVTLCSHRHQKTVQCLSVDGNLTWRVAFYLYAILAVQCNRVCFNFHSRIARDVNLLRRLYVNLAVAQLYLYAARLTAIVDGDVVVGRNLYETAFVVQLQTR